MECPFCILPNHLLSDRCPDPRIEYYKQNALMTYNEYLNEIINIEYPNEKRELLSRSSYNLHDPYYWFSWFHDRLKQKCSFLNTHTMIYISMILYNNDTYLNARPSPDTRNDILSQIAHMHAQGTTILSISNIRRFFQNQDQVEDQEEEEEAEYDEINDIVHIKENKICPDTMCPICYIYQDNMIHTECNHIFCTSCITQHLHISHACPLCRNRINNIFHYKVISNV